MATNLTAPGAAAYTVKVSSVLNRDHKQFGRRNLFDGDDETCWNSAQGSPQYVSVDFDEPVVLSELRIMFQGGFVGQGTVLQRCAGDDGAYETVAELFPEDSNALQVFAVPDVAGRRFRLFFESSTDFFGRVTIYSLELCGRQ